MWYVTKVPFESDRERQNFCLEMIREYNIYGADYDRLKLSFFITNEKYKNLPSDVISMLEMQDR